MRRIKLLFITTHPIQYQIPLFRHLAADDALDFQVLFCHSEAGVGFVDPGFGVDFSWDISLFGGYTHRILYPHPPRSRGWQQVELARAILRYVMCVRPDAVVLHGWPSRAFLYAWMWLLARSIKVIQFCDGNIEQRQFLRRSRLNSVALGALLRSCSSCCYVGSKNRAFYASHGVATERLFATPYAVDNEFFASRCAVLQPQRRELLMAMGLSPDHGPTLLFCGKLIAKKRVKLIVEAFHRANLDGRANLVLVGDGQERGELEHMIADLGLQNVRLVGFLNQTEMPRAYAVADVLVLVSDPTETWGLVVNEAMACGIPVIASESVGCAPDMVADHGCGWVVEFDSVSSLARAFSEVVADPGGLRIRGERARMVAQSHTFETMGAGFREAALATQSVKAKHGVQAAGAL